MKFRFYVKMDGETYGPYSVKELMELGLLDDTLISEESMNGEWHQAREFNFEELLQKEQEPSPVNMTNQPSASKSYLKWLFLLVATIIVVSGVVYVTSDSSDTPVNPVTPNPFPTPPTNGTLAICPMCNGTGLFDYMPGDIVAPKTKCSGCNGAGKVDQTKAAEILKVQQQLNPTNRTVGGTTNTGQDHNKCPDCYGDGKCSSCAGRGEKRYEGQYGQPDGIMDCPRCHGTGKCQTCYGRGSI